MLFKPEITGAIRVALFVFIVTIAHTQATGKPLTPSMYTVDEGSIEGYCGIDLIQTNRTHIKEYVHIHTAILPGTDIRFSASMLQVNSQQLSNTTIGDSTIGIWHSFGLLCNTVLSGIILELVLPAAPDVYYNETTMPAESGITTFSLSFVAAYATHPLTIIFSGCYTLMPKPGESVFEGLSLNILRVSTWKNVFGLNPFKKGSMLYYTKLSDDIVSVALTAVYEIFPVIPYLSFCLGDRVNNSPVYGEHELPVLYKGYNDTFFLVTSMGIRYFFSEKTFIGTGLLYNVLQNYDYSIQYAISLEASSVW